MKNLNRVMIVGVFGALLNLSGCIVPVPVGHDHPGDDRRETDHRDDHHDRDDRCEDRNHDGHCDHYR